ncbi:MAG: hypothetical protein JXB34_08610 [Bacteroidales bacterium]|nr:hypothetical protein [Bacteroidales bacterium]
MNKHFFLALAFFTFFLNAAASDHIKRQMKELKAEVAEKGHYANLKSQRADSIRLLLNSTSPENFHAIFTYNQKLFNEYKSYIYDSAFNYALKIEEIARFSGDNSIKAQSKINFGFILISSGMFKEAFDTLKTIRTQEMPRSLLAEYYSLMERAYLDLMGYNSNVFFTEKYNDIRNSYIDSTLQLFPDNQKYQLYYSGLRYIENKNFRQAQQELETLTKDYRNDDHFFAMTASSLAYVYLCTGQTNDAITMLFESVKADIRSCTRETTAAFKLAELLYTHGYTKEAHYLIELAMHDATFYNSNLRKKQISSILPVIAAKELSTTIKQRKLLFRYSVATTLLSVLVVAFLFITIRHVRQLKRAKESISDINSKLLESNKIKDEYIGFYFYNNSDYINKIEKFKKAIIRKLMTKRVDDIEIIINNINPQKEREELFAGFDKVFLRLFPDFIKHFNSLLKPEERILPKDKNTLTTDMRIFALIRIGIGDHEKIAEILGYSVSTIYNYKTKIRKKAIVPHDKFEEEILKIKAI